MFDEKTLKELDDAFNRREREREEVEVQRRAAEKRRRKGVVVRKASNPEASKEGEEGEQAMDVDDNEDVKEEVRSPSPTAGQMEEPEPERPVAEAEAEAVVKEEVVPPEVVVPADPRKVVEIPGETAVARARRLRPKAEDMFALDEED